MRAHIGRCRHIPPDLSLSRPNPELVLKSSVYTCNVCDNMFTSSTNLEDHIIFRHGLQKNDTTSNFARIPGDYIIQVDGNNTIDNDDDDDTDDRDRDPARRKCQSADNYSIGVYEDSSISEMYTCSLCTCTFPNRGDLSNHIQTTHGPLQNNQHWGKMLESLSTELLFTCYKCDKNFTTHSNLAIHVQTFHVSPTSYSCNLCGLTFHAINLLAEHSTECHELPPTEVHCNRCVFTCQSMAVLNAYIGAYHEVTGRASHTRSLPQEAMLSCSICDATFRNEHKLQEHTLTYHLRPQPSTCLSCCKTFQTKADLDNHLQSYMCSAYATPANPISPIPQVDGNVSLPAENIFNKLSDPAIISAGGAVSNPGPGVQLPYTLNSVNQARRIFENTSRPVLNICYNNPQMTDGHHH
jgi:uncharacterized C2H2 Zn-finger protein